MTSGIPLFRWAVSVSGLLLLVATVGCTPPAVPPAASAPSAQPPPVRANPAPAAPTLPPPSSTGPARYQDATYEVDRRPVSLVDGLAEAPAAPGSASKITTRIFGNEAMGDLDGDGTPDVAFILTHSGGGSGTFYYTVAALRTADGYRGTNAVFLGDRVAPQPTTIEAGVVTVNYADRAPGEPMTAQPSVGVSKHLRVVDRRLVEVD